jgi:DNA-binding response OmpR family regulator
VSHSILIVEDDENLRIGLEDNLDAEGYAVTAAADGAQARAAIDAGEFDLVVLDLMLPDTDGYTLCRELRERGCRSMVLMLTARTLEDDLVQGFDAGADDYLAKPYRLRELLVRVRALLRRSQGAPAGEALALGAWRIDLPSRQVLHTDGEEAHLTRTEFDLLVYLLKNPGRALARDLILDEVWGRDVVVDTRTVDNFVSSLKKKLRWSPECGFSIETVRGVGYRLEL